MELHACDSLQESPPSRYLGKIGYDEPTHICYSYIHKLGRVTRRFLARP